MSLMRGIFIPLFLSVIVMLSEGTFQRLSDKVKRACTEIYNPKVLVTSCCKQNDQFVERIKSCVKQGKTKVFSKCSEAICVTTTYGILTEGEIDPVKVKTELLTLNKIDAETKAMNKLITKYCLNMDYKNFPSGDPNCSPWKFVNCAFYAYAIGCAETKSNGSCGVIKNNIETCRPRADAYVAQLTERNCFY